MNIDEREEEEDSVTSSESISSTYNTSDPIDNLPSVSNSEDSSQNGDAERCCICLLYYTEDDNDRKLPLKCGHVFHSDCIEPWLRQNGTCPLCRTKIRDVTPAEPRTMFIPIAQLISLAQARFREQEISIRTLTSTEHMTIGQLIERQRIVPTRTAPVNTMNDNTSSRPIRTQTPVNSTNNDRPSNDQSSDSRCGAIIIVGLLVCGWIAVYLSSFYSGEFDLKTMDPQSRTTTRYKSSCTKFPVREAGHFREIEIEFEVFPNIPKAQYIANSRAIYATDNSNIQLGLATYENAVLKYSTNSVFVELELTVLDLEEGRRKWRLSAWKKGYLMQNVTFIETFEQPRPLKFLFRIESKRIRLSVYNNHGKSFPYLRVFKEGFSDLRVFENFRINSAIYLCAGMEPPVLPTKILYKVKNL